jgi:4-hydroxybutyrate CoA-transferase
MKRLHGWERRAAEASEVVAHLQSGQKVFVHGAAATPTALLEAMVERRDLEGVELYHIHLNGPVRFCEPDSRKAFTPNSLFTGGNLR